MKREKSLLKKWSVLSITALMSVALLFGVTGCADNNNDLIIEDNVPNNPPANDENTDVDLDVETPENTPDESNTDVDVNTGTPDTNPQ